MFSVAEINDDNFKVELVSPSSTKLQALYHPGCITKYLLTTNTFVFFSIHFIVFDDTVNSQV